MTAIQVKRPTFDPAPFIARIERGEAVCGQFAMRIDRNGRWYHQGTPIGRPALVRLFAAVLHRVTDGSYWLVTPGEQGSIEVEDVPFVALEMRGHGSGRERRLDFRTNLDEWVTAGPAHPLTLRRAGTPPVEVPYLLVRNGLEARLSRSVFYELVEEAEPAPNGTGLGIWSAGSFFPIGRTEDA